jgi:4'-phosphopantetheinyl transferase
MRVTISSVRCQVWWARPAVETPRLLDLLDPIERTRYTAYHRTIDQLRFLTGRVVSKALAAEALAIEPAQLTLDSTCPDCGRPHGKPRVVPPPDHPEGLPLPELSISHSGDLVAVAITAGLPVGVDVEQERDVQVQDLARMTLSPDETATFAEVPNPDRDAAFFTYWARKEALLKATGRGLSIPMTRITLTPWNQPPRVLASQSSEVDPSAIHMAHLDAAPGYRAAVAVLAGPDFPATGWISEHAADPLIAKLS